MGKIVKYPTSLAREMVENSFQIVSQYDTLKMCNSIISENRNYSEYFLKISKHFEEDQPLFFLTSLTFNLTNFNIFPNAIISAQEVNDFNTNGIIVKTLPRVTSEELDKMVDELKKYKKFVDDWRNFFNEKNNIIASAFELPFFDFGWLFSPTLVHVVNKNREFFEGAAESLVGASKEYLVLNLGGSAVIEPNDHSFICHKDGIKLGPPFTDSVAFNLALTKVDQNRCPLYIFNKIDEWVTQREYLKDLRKDEILSLGKEYIDKNFSVEDVLKLIACIEFGIIDMNSSIWGPIIAFFYHVNLKKVLERDGYENFFFAENNPGEGFFFLPWKDTHCANIPNLSNEPRVTYSIRLNSFSAFTKINEENYKINFEDEFNDSQKKNFLLSAIFGVKVVGKKLYSCLKFDENNKNECQNIEDLKAFHELDQVKNFFLQENYNNSFPDVISLYTKDLFSHDEL
jgi:hypothetical protein